MEKATTILFSIYFLMNNIFAQDFKFSAKSDLNSDSNQETIKLEKINNSSDFKLLVNNVSIHGKFEMGETEGFIITDINTNDKFKEIAVYTPGPSDDHEYKIYRYDGLKLILISSISGIPNFTGNGIVYVDEWEGFWTSREKYVLDETKQILTLTPQFANYVGVKAKVSKSFTLFRETGLINKVASLNVGSNIELILCDKAGQNFETFKYLIKSESGLIGWASFKSITQSVEGLPFAD